MLGKKSLFLEKVGDDPFYKVLEIFIENDGFPLSKGYVAEETEMSRTTLTNVWGRMLDQRIINGTERSGRTMLFELNDESVLVDYFKKIYRAVISNKLTKLIENNRIERMNSVKYICVENNTKNITRKYDAKCGEPCKIARMPVFASASA